MTDGGYRCPTSCVVYCERLAAHQAALADETNQENAANDQAEPDSGNHEQLNAPPAPREFAPNQGDGPERTGELQREGRNEEELNTDCNAQCNAVPGNNARGCRRTCEASSEARANDREELMLLECFHTCVADAGSSDDDGSSDDTAELEEDCETKCDEQVRFNDRFDGRGPPHAIIGALAGLSVFVGVLIAVTRYRCKVSVKLMGLVDEKMSKSWRANRWMKISKTELKANRVDINVVQTFLNPP
jgi:hypothetical protein